MDRSVESCLMTDRHSLKLVHELEDGEIGFIHSIPQHQQSIHPDVQEPTIHHSPWLIQFTLIFTEHCSGSEWQSQPPRLDLSSMSFFHSLRLSARLVLIIIMRYMIILIATQLYPEIEELALGHLREALNHYERKSEVLIIVIHISIIIIIRTMIIMDMMMVIIIHICFWLSKQRVLYFYLKPVPYFSNWQNYLQKSKWWPAYKYHQHCYHCMVLIKNLSWTRNARSSDSVALMRKLPPNKVDKSVQFAFVCFCIFTFSFAVLNRPFYIFSFLHF